MAYINARGTTLVPITINGKPTRRIIPSPVLAQIEVSDEVKAQIGKDTELVFGNTSGGGSTQVMVLIGEMVLPVYRHMKSVNRTDAAVYPQQYVRTRSDRQENGSYIVSVERFPMRGTAEGGDGKPKTSKDYTGGVVNDRAMTSANGHSDPIDNTFTQIICAALAAVRAAQANTRVAVETEAPEGAFEAA